MSVLTQSQIMKLRQTFRLCLTQWNVNDGLAETILYTLNPKDNYVLATMLGNFQSAETAGKMQFGSAWWFNDQRDGMVEQMKALANLGAFNKFVGMLTDSRSFLSYLSRIFQTYSLQYAW